MPFHIVRNDITKVKADAIVNTANPKPIHGGGTDTAIYRAAGESTLLAARKKIGDIMQGEAAYTPGFALKARYIIHTVGPAWHGGDADEFEILRSCYLESLKVAEKLKCRSVAFPLIAAGINGFPKDKALQIATAAFQEFLFEHDMDITLVVFDEKAFQLSGKVYQQIDSFIDENYVEQQRRKQMGISSAYRVRPGFGHVVAPYDKMAEWPRAGKGPTQGVSGIFLNGMDGKSLDDIMDGSSQTFQQRLFDYIDRRGMSEVEVYKRANVSKKVFSTIRSHVDYQPKKKTAVAFAIALQLNMPETLDLIGRAGYTFSPSDKFDLAMGYFINHGIYNIYDINNKLFEKHQPLLGE